jgi:GDPmannose 4,6-dehydratase
MSDSKTALVTGITGQDGSYLAEFLLDKGYRVVGLARRSTHYDHANIAHLAGKISLEYGDLVDPHAVDRLIVQHQPDEVYNLAAQSVPADSWSQPIVTAEITGLAPIRLLEALHRHKPEARFYQASTREIYGGIRAPVVDETTPLLANNPYGAAKLYAHVMTEVYRQSYSMFACTGVLFNHESPRRSLHFVTRKVSMAVACIKLGIQNPPLNELGQPLIERNMLRLGNLEAVRDWGYAKEYVEAMWLMLQQDEPQTFIIATNTAHTVRDLCQIAFSHVGLDWQKHVTTDQRFLRPTEIEAQRGDYSKAKAVLGWEPQTTFRDLVTLMVDADLKRMSG